MTTPSGELTRSVLPPRSSATTLGPSVAPAAASMEAPPEPRGVCTMRQQPKPVSGNGRQIPASLSARRMASAHPCSASFSVRQAALATLRAAFTPVIWTEADRGRTNPGASLLSAGPTPQRCPSKKEEAGADTSSSSWKPGRALFSLRTTLFRIRAETVVRAARLLRGRSSTLGPPAGGGAAEAAGPAGLRCCGSSSSSCCCCGSPSSSSCCCCCCCAAPPGGGPPSGAVTASAAAALLRGPRCMLAPAHLADTPSSARLNSSVLQRTFGAKAVRSSRVIRVLTLRRSSSRRRFASSKFGKWFGRIFLRGVSAPPSRQPTTSISTACFFPCLDSKLVTVVDTTL
mmetsp:Transcript_39284/g.93045  ORF Transcript_39284/g.93045 Transcript_39284/m.93045 type:complete len:344 (+) Transcript_39284:958-1989(+)